MTISEVKEWVETIRDRKGRGDWGVANGQLRDWVETIRDIKGRGN